MYNFTIKDKKPQKLDLPSGQSNKLITVNHVISLLPDLIRMNPAIPNRYHPYPINFSIVSPNYTLFQVVTSNLSRVYNLPCQKQGFIL